MTMTLHHLALRTADLAALAAFYRDLLGLEVVRDASPHSLWLGLGGDAALMIEARADGEPGVPDGSMELAAFRVSVEQKDAVAHRARERGCFDGETAFTVYFRDPDGRRVGVSTYDLAGTTR
jgi:catechol 2,3-dioxygenase-like lactoylglutathione lyase family enzyme